MRYQHKLRGIFYIYLDTAELHAPNFDSDIDSVSDSPSTIHEDISTRPECSSAPNHKSFDYRLLFPLSCKWKLIINYIPHSFPAFSDSTTKHGQEQISEWGPPCHLTTRTRRMLNETRLRRQLLCTPPSPTYRHNQCLWLYAWTWRCGQARIQEHRKNNPLFTLSHI